jgi:hypothetical protein
LVEDALSIHVIFSWLQVIYLKISGQPEGASTGRLTVRIQAMETNLRPLAKLACLWSFRKGVVTVKFSTPFWELGLNGTEIEG